MAANRLTYTAYQLPLGCIVRRYSIFTNIEIRIINYPLATSVHLQRVKCGVVPDFGSGKSGIRPFTGNPAKFGSG